MPEFRFKSWASQLFIFFLLLQMGRTGLPQISVHHVNTANGPHCNCGCSCGENPGAPGSCLNPAAYGHIACGCKKQHEREVLIPVPALCEVLLPRSTRLWLYTGLTHHMLNSFVKLAFPKRLCEPGPPF